MAGGWLEVGMGAIIPQLGWPPDCSARRGLDEA